MPPARRPRLVVVGGGPAGLMAAEAACARGIAVDLFEAKGSVGRKFLVAGKGGLNLTHSEPFESFVERYRGRADIVRDWLREFDADALRAWARGLGIETFVGSSGRVFPCDLKAAPLLRAWVHRLRVHGVQFHVHHRCLGWAADGALRFATPAGEACMHADAAVLALGGGSWPELGSDGAWVEWLAATGVAVAALAPSNCGFDVGWSEHFRERHAGAPLKPVAAVLQDPGGHETRLQGECVLTATGIEGSLVYALSASLREDIERHGEAWLHLDLLPGRDLAWVRAQLDRDRAGRSLSEHLRRRLGIEGAKAGLLFELVPAGERTDPGRLANALKALPLRLRRPRPLAEAISSAGGVRFAALQQDLMLNLRPGVFCAGEMLDWEAPTGGYLLTACFASGRRAGTAAAAWLERSGTLQPA